MSTTRERILQFIEKFLAKRDYAPTVRDILKGKRVVVIEDSIIRGTTTRSRVKSLYDKEFTAEDRALAKFYGLDIPELKL